MHGFSTLGRKRAGQNKCESISSRLVVCLGHFFPLYQYYYYIHVINDLLREIKARVLFGRSERVG